MAYGWQSGSGENVLAEAKKVVNQVLGLDVDIVRAKQLPSRNGKPPCRQITLDQYGINIDRLIQC